MWKKVFFGCWEKLSQCVWIPSHISCWKLRCGFRFHPGTIYHVCLNWCIVLIERRQIQLRVIFGIEIIYNVRMNHRELNSKFNFLCSYESILINLNSFHSAWNVLNQFDPWKIIKKNEPERMNLCGRRKCLISLPIPFLFLQHWQTHKYHYHFPKTHSSIQLFLYAHTHFVYKSCSYEHILENRKFISFD
jgi:uncharacterized membrane protein YoaT (DUF817 family)